MYNNTQMKIEFLNEGVFKSLKGPRDSKEERLAKVKADTVKIAKMGLKNQVTEIYAKVLAMFVEQMDKYAAASGSYGIESICYDPIKIFNEKAQTFFFTKTTDSFTSNHDGFSEDFYTNFAKSLYGQKDLLVNDLQEVPIYVAVHRDSAITDNVSECEPHFKTIVNTFKKCVKEVMKGYSSTLVKTPTSYKIAIVNGLEFYNTYGRPELTGAYHDICDGTSEYNTDFLIHYGDFNGSRSMYTNYMAPTALQKSGGSCNFTSDTYHKFVENYEKYLLNPALFYNDCEIRVKYFDLHNKDFYKFVDEVTEGKYKVPVRELTIGYEPNQDSQNVAESIKNVFELVENINKLKEKKPQLAKARIDIPTIFRTADAGYLSFQSKDLAYDCVNKKITPLGTKLGIQESPYKFVRNIYALDVTSNITPLITKCVKTALASHNITLGKYDKQFVTQISDSIADTLSKLLKLRPQCCIGNYLLLCSYTQGGTDLSNIARLFFDDITINFKSKYITVVVKYDFKLACASGINVNYKASPGLKPNGKSYEYISPKNLKIKIPF